MVENQALIFMIFTINGILIGILFDFFRILRKVIKTNNIATYIEDLIFWILTGIIIIFSMYKYCDGELRFFMIIGLVIGLLFYIFTFSKKIIKFSVYIIEKLKNILSYPLKILIRLIKKIFFQPVIFLFINLKKSKKIEKIIKKGKKICNKEGFFVKMEK